MSTSKTRKPGLVVENIVSGRVVPGLRKGKGSMNV